MLITICDINDELIRQCYLQRDLAGDSAALTFRTGDIFRCSADATVSPANSFGFMDGGIDLAYSRFFGWDLQRRVQEKIKTEHAGELLIGQSFSVETGMNWIRNLIVAPTMRVPSMIGQLEVYLATRAAIRCASEKGFEHVLLPGMGTGCGQVPFELAAKQMLLGIRDAMIPPEFPRSLMEIAERHRLTGFG